MNSWLIVVLFLILGSVFLENLAIILNLRALNTDLPKDFTDLFSLERYSVSQRYVRAQCRLDLSTGTCISIISMLFILLDGFRAVDDLIRSFCFGEVFSGLIYVVILTSMAYIISLPFTLYRTFVIEEEFGFNRTTAKVFTLDALKGMLLLVILGTPILTMIFWLFLHAGDLAWVYCWASVTLFSLLLHYFAPTVIMPLFTKFSPICDHSLQAKIEQYANQEKVPFKTIVTADGSKRSSKGNAFFAGFGRFRRIVLFDTLLEKLSEDEIVAVLAHEIGHYKLNHLWKMAGVSSFQTALIFFTSSLIFENTSFLHALGVKQTSVYIPLVVIAYLYHLLDPFLSVPIRAISRRHEHQADGFAAATCNPQLLIGALKKLSHDNLSNLTPHPLYVFLHYSHPPISNRLRVLQHFYADQPLPKLP